MGEKIKEDKNHENRSIPCDMSHEDKREQSYVDVEDDLLIDSVMIRCSNCMALNLSRVEEENILTDERTWAMLCGCFGSCFAIYNVISGQKHYGFMKYTHYCQKCNEIIKVYQPESSTKLKIIIVILISVIISLKVIVFVTLVLPNI